MSGRVGMTGDGVTDPVVLELRTLRRENKRLRDAVDRQRVAVDRQTFALKVRTGIFALLLIALTLVGARVSMQLQGQVDAARETAASARRIATSQKVLCPIVTLYLPKPGGEQPTTAAGVERAKAFADLSRQLDC